MVLPAQDFARTLFVGDVHGCLDEMLQLLDDVQYAPRRDRLVFLGDLVDRGPKSVGTVKVVRLLSVASENVYCVQGNHEEKHVRYAKHERVFAESGKKNPMHFSKERHEEHAQLTPEEVAWLAELPVVLRFSTGKQTWLATHAGCPTDKPLHELDPKALVRTRYVDAVTGKYATDKTPFTQPVGSVPWYEKWVGPEHVVYGHHVHGLENAYVTGTDVKCFGVDTGCVFGGRLTALVVSHADESYTFAQVQARKVYHHNPRLEWSE